jgi:hypothetical protein
LVNKSANESVSALNVEDMLLMKKIKAFGKTGILFVAVCLAHFAVPAADKKMELVSAKKIWGSAPHNAFTDLIRFQGNWFCTFRESEAHVGGNGKIRVLTSVDGEKWESAALLGEEGIDLRDPKLSITPRNNLMLVLGGSVYKGKELIERQSRVSFSKNGRDWTAPKRVLEKGEWLWRVTWHREHAYGIAYNSSIKPDWTAKLVESRDGLSFQTVTVLDVPGQPNEATLHFIDNNDCVALVRRESGDKQAWIGTSRAPYKDWKWKPAGMQIGGPNFIVLGGYEMFASGRQYGATSKDAKTFLGTMTMSSVKPDVIFPSGGDCSYAGMAWYDDMIWLSYYSSHENKTSIYLAKVKVTEVGAKPGL